MPGDAEGVEYHLLRGLDGPRPERVTVTLGSGELVASLELSVPRACCDGVALFHRDPDWSDTPFDPHVAFPDLLWVGPWTHPELVAHLDASCGMEAIPAVSFDALAALVAAELSLVRPDLVLDYDAEHLHHISPTCRWLSELSEGERYTILPREEGRLEVQVSDQVMDVLLAAELEHAAHLDALDPVARAAYEQAAAWLAWTDGTYDPRWPEE